MNKSISDILGLPDLSSDKVEIVQILDHVEATDDMTVDYKAVRNNFYELIKKGNRALDEIISVAEKSQNPTSFVALSTLMKTLIEANKELSEHSRKKEFLNKLDENLDTTDSGEKAPTVTNNLFVGSTADFQKILKDMKDANS